MMMKSTYKKRKQANVKWKGYDNLFNNWIFLNLMNLLVETLMSKMNYLIMQQKLI